MEKLSMVGVQEKVREALAEISASYEKMEAKTKTAILVGAGAASLAGVTIALASLRRKRGALNAKKTVASSERKEAIDQEPSTSPTSPSPIKEKPKPKPKAKETASSSPIKGALRQITSRAPRRKEGDLAMRSHYATKPALSYIDIFVKAMGDQYSRANPNGYIILLIAENKLTTDMVSKRFRQVRSVPDSVFAYTSFLGDLGFRSAVAGYAEQTFAKDAGAAGQSIDPESLALSSGCGAVIDNICFAVCDPGSEILIPAPYYPAFDNDLRVKSNVIPFPVLPSSEKTILPSNDDLDKAFSRCRNPRILLLTNPHNPLGVVLRPEETKRCVKWALQKSLHVISDEIYANSCHGEGTLAEGNEFRSAIAMMPELSEELGSELVEQRVHTIFGFSKDFCASGLRIGALHSKNTHLLKSIENIGYFCGVSGHTGECMKQVLEDQKWVKKFVTKNKQNLRKSYLALSSQLDHLGLRYLPANAGMFVWLDLRKYLKEATWDGEKELWTALAEDCKVLFTPGKDCHARDPGFFRICFAWVPEQALGVALQRVAAYLKKY